MHPPEVKAAAMKLIESGLNDCEVARRTGIPRSTVRDWRRPSYIPRELSPPRGRCPRCWLAGKLMRFTPEDYSEFLAMYLGDGCVSRHPRTHRLRIALDAKYPGIVAAARALIERCMPHNPVGLVEAHGGTMFFVSVYSSHLPCLLPQDGEGLKHERPIVLEPWQRKLFEAAPWPFIRGCIRTDGCVFINRTNVHRPQPYEYLSDEFSNMSAGIVELFIEASDRVGVFTRANRNRRGLWQVRINRRASVALMLEHVGLKT